MCRGITNIAWAFAALGHWDEKLFTASAREAKLRIGAFKPQETATKAWAFAKLGE